MNKALENAKSECNRLNNVYVGEIEKKEFLEKSLAVAKAEWERLVQENARLTDELELLKGIHIEQFFTVRPICRIKGGK